MPRFNFGLNKAAAGVESSSGGYSGPPPANGTYSGKLRRLTATEAEGPTPEFPDRKTPKGTPVLSVMVVIDGPPKIKRGGKVIKNPYIGAAVWRRYTVTEQNVPYVNQFLDVIAGSKAQAVKEAFWGDKGPYVDDDGHVLKIGGLKVGSPDGEIPVMVTTKQHTYKGNTTADIGRFLRPQSTDEEDEITDDDADDADDDDLEIDDDTDDDDDVDDVDDDDDDIPDDQDVAEMEDDDEPVQRGKSSAPF